MTTQVEAELKRQPQGGGALVAWELVDDADNPDTARADPVRDYGVRDRLDTVNERYAGGLSTETGTATASGDTEMVAAPGAGLAIKLYWVTAITDTDETTAPVIIVMADGGQEFYRAAAISHWEPFTLPENTALVINLSQASSVPWTVHYKTVAV